jgi:nitrile hydratase accessory protein
MNPAEHLAAEIPGIPRGEDGPVFREPWEAQAFAIAVALHQRGLFTWPEWAATLAGEIERARAEGDPDLGDTYYRHWLAALERLAAEKGAAEPASLARCRAAWAHAASRTPHGTPITLADEDFAAAEGCCLSAQRRAKPPLPPRSRGGMGYAHPKTSCSEN